MTSHLAENLKLLCSHYRSIAEVCRTRDIAIVSDEIYHGLSYVGPTASMLQFAPDAMIINSFSKS